MGNYLIYFYYLYKTIINQQTPVEFVFGRERFNMERKS